MKTILLLFEEITFPDLGVRNNIVSSQLNIRMVLLNTSNNDSNFK